MATSFPWDKKDEGLKRGTEAFGSAAKESAKLKNDGEAAPASGAVDSSALGFYSAQKSTTHVRGKDDKENAIVTRPCSVCGEPTATMTQTEGYPLVCQKCAAKERGEKANAVDIHISVDGDGSVKVGGAPVTGESSMAATAPTDALTRSKCEACGNQSQYDWTGTCPGCATKYAGEPNGKRISTPQTPQPNEAPAARFGVKENSDMKSKCEACGHESPNDWSGKCESCATEYAGEAGGARSNGMAPEQGEPWSKLQERANDDERMTHYSRNMGKSACGLQYDPLTGKMEDGSNTTSDPYRIRGCQTCMDASGVWAKDEKRNALGNKAFGIKDSTRPLKDLRNGRACSTTGCDNRAENFCKKCEATVCDSCADKAGSIRGQDAYCPKCGGPNAQVTRQNAMGFAQCKAKWSSMSQEERTAFLKKIFVPEGYASKEWDSLSEIAQDNLAESMSELMNSTFTFRAEDGTIETVDAADPKEAEDKLTALLVSQGNAIRRPSFKLVNSSRADFAKWQKEYDAVLEKMRPLTDKMHELEDKHDLPPTPRGQTPKGPEEYVSVMRQITELEKQEERMLANRPVSLDNAVPYCDACDRTSDKCICEKKNASGSGFSGPDDETCKCRHTEANHEQGSSTFCLQCDCMKFTAPERKNSPDYGNRHPDFIKWVKQAAAANGMSEDALFAKWKEHVAASGDQSALTSEFLDWNKMKGYDMSGRPSRAQEGLKNGHDPLPRERFILLLANYMAIKQQSGSQSVSDLRKKNEQYLSGMSDAQLNEMSQSTGFLHTVQNSEKRNGAKEEAEAKFGPSKDGAPCPKCGSKFTGDFKDGFACFDCGHTKMKNAIINAVVVGEYKGFRLVQESARGFAAFEKNSSKLVAASSISIEELKKAVDDFLNDPSTTRENGNMKYAWVRDRNVPEGQPATGKINCPCGGAPESTFADGKDVNCACGRVFDSRGWILKGPELENSSDKKCPLCEVDGEKPKLDEKGVCPWCKRTFSLENSDTFNVHCPKCDDLTRHEGNHSATEKGVRKCLECGTKYEFEDGGWVAKNGFTTSDKMVMKENVTCPKCGDNGRLFVSEKTGICDSCMNKEPEKKNADDRHVCECKGECNRSEPSLKHDGPCKNWNVPGSKLCVTCAGSEKKNSTEDESFQRKFEGIPCGCGGKFHRVGGSGQSDPDFECDECGKIARIDDWGRGLRENAVKNADPKKDQQDTIRRDLKELAGHEKVMGTTKTGNGWKTMTIDEARRLGPDGTDELTAVQPHQGRDNSVAGPCECGHEYDDHGPEVDGYLPCRDCKCSTFHKDPMKNSLIIKNATFSFIDPSGAIETVKASSVASAWVALSNSIGASVVEMKAAGIKIKNAILAQSTYHYDVQVEMAGGKTHLLQGSVKAFDEDEARKLIADKVKKAGATLVKSMELAVSQFGGVQNSVEIPGERLSDGDDLPGLLNGNDLDFDMLRTEFGSHDTISMESAEKLMAIVHAANDEAILRLLKENVKFVTKLARNEATRRGLKENSVKNADEKTCEKCDKAPATETAKSPEGQSFNFCKRCANEYKRWIDSGETDARVKKNADENADEKTGTPSGFMCPKCNQEMQWGGRSPKGSLTTWCEKCNQSYGVAEMKNDDEGLKATVEPSDNGKWRVVNPISGGSEEYPTKEMAEYAAKQNKYRRTDSPGSATKKNADDHKPLPDNKVHCPKDDLPHNITLFADGTSHCGACDAPVGEGEKRNSSNPADRCSSCDHPRKQHIHEGGMDGCQGAEGKGGCGCNYFREVGEPTWRNSVDLPFSGVARGSSKYGSRENADKTPKCSVCGVENPENPKSVAGTPVCQGCRERMAQVARDMMRGA